MIFLLKASGRQKGKGLVHLSPGRLAEAKEF